MLLENREMDVALRHFYEAESLGADPDSTAAGRWTCWMLKGEFERAWQESDRIRQLQSSDPHRYWDGQALDQRHILLRCLHGFGDDIQFLRYLPQLRAIAKSITLQVPPPLLPLFRRMPCVDTVITWKEPEPSWDTQIECMELPYIFRTTLENIPSPLMCLPPQEESRREISRRKDLLHVGLVWSAGEWNPSRSISTATLKPLLRMKGVAFHNLQGGAASKEWPLLSKECHILTAPVPDGILNLAAAIEEMDLIITVDTLAAHLGGTLGKPVWLLLQYAADWRWMIDRQDSPWYPSMAIFRRGRTENWSSLIWRVQKCLENFLTERVSRRTQDSLNRDLGSPGVEIRT